MLYLALRHCSTEQAFMNMKYDFYLYRFLLIP